MKTALALLTLVGAAAAQPPAPQRPAIVGSGRKFLNLSP